MCGDKCLNRLTYKECNPVICACGNNCKNTQIQKNNVPQIEPVLTQEKGFGVNAQQFIKKDSFIIEYVGEVITENEMNSRISETSDSSARRYLMKLENNLFIDGYRKGNIARLINHSCDPNSEIQKWTVDGFTRLALFSIKDIQSGEEISYNYHYVPFGTAEICKCGANNCKGFISKKEVLLPQRPQQVKFSLSYQNIGFCQPCSKFS